MKILTDATLAAAIKNAADYAAKEKKQSDPMAVMVAFLCGSIQRMAPKSAAALEDTLRKPDGGN